MKEKKLLKETDQRNDPQDVVGMVSFETYVYGKLVEKGENPLFKGQKWDIVNTKSLGIGTINSAYIETNDIQDKNHEYIKINKFLNKYKQYYAEKKNIDISTLKLDFINYGKTELVYVLTDGTGQQSTILVKQPAVEFGKVKQEANNLTQLNKVDSKVVAPIDYFSYGDQELFVTTYIKQARCIASDGVWGMYIPEPFYRFEPFTQEQKSLVNSCMIAKLISLYDVDKCRGISKCKLGGGDFILPKDWESKTPTIDNILDNLYLIAARDMISCSFDEYVDIIRDEFSKRTIGDDQDSLRLNIRGRVPMEYEEIEQGIALGKQLLSQKMAADLETSK